MLKLAKEKILRELAGDPKYWVSTPSNYAEAYRKLVEAESLEYQLQRARECDEALKG